MLKQSPFYNGSFDEPYDEWSSDVIWARALRVQELKRKILERAK